jgi:crotonobetainyl-CoA:carnitine CoA-transferase CaiB-like acyl-CoA transferase
MPRRRLGGARHGHSQRQFWPQVCQALGEPDLATDPRFATAELREQNSLELVKILDGLFGAIDYADWERQATENDFISTRVNALTDLAGDPQIRANGYITELPHKDLGEFAYVATPLEFSKTPVSIRNCAPEVGENNVELLQGWLGMSDDDVEGLVERRVI